MALTHSLLSPGEIALRVGANARATRLGKNLSRKTLAQMSGVSESTIKRFESSGQVTLDALVLLANALGTTQQLVELFSQGSPASLDEIRQAGRSRGRK